MWSAKALAAVAWAHRLHSGHKDCCTERVPPSSCPHAHLCERAMPNAWGSDLEAGKFLLIEPGSGRVTSPNTELDNSISRVSHQQPHNSVRLGHMGPLGAQEVCELHNSGLLPAMLGSSGRQILPSGGSRLSSICCPCRRNVRIEQLSPETCLRPVQRIRFS